MSRSKRRNPVRGITTAESEKTDKQMAHRRIRRVTKHFLTANPLTEILPNEKELSNPWCMEKDGKQRFDAAKYPEWMRKFLEVLGSTIVP